ncbi:DNA-directed RNA polymerase subunit beta [Streptococcus anginosus]|uniref:DNA-directed RNA polymerase subunit beta n=1 Tax=Streptococcus anginosus TaxID=1328 RepID=UPI000E441DC7|nr:DNA-directed RNA polymerase subunit beta [Streptococcus anginosus]RGN68811.1 DNA-directed RNA polymerase subunit beta [Streptococcus anginosus]
MNNDLKYVGKQVGIVLAVLLLGLILFALGLVVGYGGKNPWDILLPDKWQEIISKFTGQ